MSNHPLRSWLACVLAASCITPATDAGQYTVRYRGDVVSSNFTSPPWDAVPANQRATLDLTFDDSIADTNPLPSEGMYPGSIISVTLTIGSFSAAGSGGYIKLLNTTRDSCSAHDVSFPGSTLLFLHLSSQASDPEENNIIIDDVLRGYTPALRWEFSYAILSDEQGHEMEIIFDRAGVIASPAPTTPCPGDANGDRAVAFIDITTVLANFGNVCP